MASDLVFAMPALPPFRLDLTAWALRRRPNNQIDLWDGQNYRRALSLGPGQEPVEVAVRQSGAPDSPELQVRVGGVAGRPGVEPVAKATLERLLGLKIDLRGFNRLAEGDEILGPLAARFRGLKPPRFPSVFEALANAIACQQVSLNVGLLLLSRLAQSFGACMSDDGESRICAFPEPQALAALQPEDLRQLGFSRAKASYLIDLAGRIAAGRLDLEAMAGLDDEEAAGRLRQLRGVGRWSAEYALLRGFGRLDVFPGDDVGAANNLQRWLGLPEKLDYDAVRQITARWQPYAGLVYLHLLLDSLDGPGGPLSENLPAGGAGRGERGRDPAHEPLPDRAGARGRGCVYSGLLAGPTDRRRTAWALFETLPGGCTSRRR